MTPELWWRVKELVGEALELAPEERPAFVTQQSGGDEELAREALALLEAVDDSFLPMASKEPAQAGPYRFVKELGRGGMGVVHLAERADGQFEQQVAVKVIKRGMDSDAILRRFRAERQILARLQHEHIARLLDGGLLETGQPYLVMEYVDGLPLRNHVQDMGEADRLRLFMEVCEAVEYAHRSMVLHRDLKAGNVLVDRNGSVKLVDFGIARLLDAGEAAGEGWTQAGWQAFTPEAASPEQKRGEALTAATDVYSLGVLLKELVDGRGDLGQIVQKATREEPEDRYPTAAELRADVERYLTGKAVLARGGSWGYRARKFTRRHWKAVSAGTLAGMAIAVSAGMAVREARLADQRFQQVRQMANEFLFEFHDAVAPLAGSTEVRALVIRRAIGYLDGLAAESGGDSGLQREVAKSYLKLGQVQGSYFEANLGHGADASASYAKAVRLLEEVERRQPYNPAVKGELAMALLRLASTENAAERPEQALRLCDRALGLLVFPHPKAVFGRGMAHFGKAEAYMKMGQTAESQAERREAAGVFESLLGKDPEAEKWVANSWRRMLTEEGVKKALTLDEGWLKRNPSDAAAKSSLAMDHAYLASLAATAGRYEDALRQDAEALAMLREIHHADPRDARTKESLLHNLKMSAKWELAAGRPSRAAGFLKEAEGLEAGR
ncbi:MAG: serine/threonine protein kinase [Acidobacteria bacterium]|nr:serine/threonine protein kinase [Acidobacteriota bacterium]